MTDQRLKVMWDWDTFPLWGDTGWIDRVSARTLSIPEGLVDELETWSDQMTALMWGTNGPGAPGGARSLRSELERLNAEGLRLAGRVREVLGESWAVTYFDEFRCADVQVSTPPAPED